MYVLSILRQEALHSPPKNRKVHGHKRGGKKKEEAVVLTDFIFPVERISRRTEAKNFNAIPPLVTSGFP